MRHVGLERGSGYLGNYCSSRSLLDTHPKELHLDLSGLNSRIHESKTIIRHPDVLMQHRSTVRVPGVTRLVRSHQPISWTLTANSVQKAYLFWYLTSHAAMLYLHRFDVDTGFKVCRRSLGFFLGWFSGSLDDQAPSELEIR